MQSKCLDTYLDTFYPVSILIQQGANMTETNKFIEEAKEGQAIDVDSALTDDQLQEGGLKPVQAWVRTKQGTNAARTKRYKDRKEAQGVKQLNLQAPEETHQVLREIAARTRSGEPLAAVLVDLSGSQKVGFFIRLVRWIRGH